MNELRQALDTLEEWRGRTELLVQMTGDVYEVATWTEEVAAAARSWLSLQEADEKTVEKVARGLFAFHYPKWDGGYVEQDNRMRAIFLSEARAVLAAIVGEET